MRAVGCRVRRPALFVAVWAVTSIGMALALATGVALRLAGLTAHVPLGSVGYLLTVPIPLLSLLSLCPVTVLAATRRALRLRATELPGIGPRQKPYTIPWEDVREVSLASGGGRLTVVVAHRDPSGAVSPRLTSVDVPGADPRTVARAISRVAPGVAVREGDRVEVLTRAGGPLLVEPRRRVPTYALVGVVGAVLSVPVLDLLGGGPAPWPSLALFWTSVCLMATRRFPVALSPRGIEVWSWRRKRVLPWAVVDAVRIAIAGEDAEMRILAGSGGLRILPGEVLTFRLRRADLADLSAVLRAYAPPSALDAARN